MAMTRTEAGALGIVVVAHAVLFGLLSVGFLATPNPDKLKPAPIQVTLSDEVGLTSEAPVVSHEEMAAKKSPVEAPLEPDTAPEPSEQPAPTPPEPEPAPQPQPKPQPAPPKPAPVAKPAPTKPSPTKPTPTKPAPAAKPAPAKPAPAAPAAKPAPARPAPAKPASAGSPAKARGPVKPTGQLEGLDLGQSDRPSRSTATTPPAATIGPQVKAALGAEVIRQLKPHWTPPSGADSEKLRTRVVVSLNRDGSLAGEPRVTQTGITDSNRSQAALAKERAIRAVRLAAPFKLPPQFYDAWKTIGPTLYEGL
jgi:outer membrane biosynthesis protein TonB